MHQNCTYSYKHTHTHTHQWKGVFGGVCFYVFFSVCFLVNVRIPSVLAMIDIGHDRLDAFFCARHQMDQASELGPHLHEYK